MNFISASRVHFTMSLKRHGYWSMFSRAGLLSLPALACLGISLSGQSGLGLFDEIAQFWLKWLIPAVAALSLAPILSEELERHTDSYLFVRPTPDLALVLGKYFAKILPQSVALAVAVPLAWLFAMARFPSDLASTAPHCLLILAVLILALLSYSALAVGIGSLLPKRPVIAVVAYLFLVEWVFGSIDFSLRYFSLNWHLRHLANFVASDGSVPTLASLAAVLVLGLAGLFGGAATIRSR